MPEKVSVPEYRSLRQDTFDPNPNPAVKADCCSGSGCRGVMTKTWEKCTAEQNKVFCMKLQFTFPYTSINGVQITKETCSSQKRTFSLKNLKSTVMVQF
jgi:hypothetical protein